MTAPCRLCVNDLVHCHGTVIQHAWSRPECTEPDCETPESIHVFTIDCSTVGCACADVVGARAAM